MPLYYVSPSSKWGTRRKAQNITASIKRHLCTYHRTMHRAKQCRKMFLLARLLQIKVDNNAEDFNEATQEQQSRF